MPPPIFLGLNVQSGNPQVRRYIGLSGSLIGNTVGTAQALVLASQPVNRVINFGNESTFLALVNGVVYRSTDNCDTWTAVYSPTSLANVFTGLNVVFANGAPIVCFIWTLNTGLVVNGSYSTDGITWIEDSGLSATINGQYFSEIVYRNTLYVCNGAAVSRIVAYTPGSALNFIPTPTGNDVEYSAMCVFNDILCLTSKNTTTGERQVFALEAGNFQIVATLLTEAAVAVAGLPGMLVDSNSGNLIVFTRTAITGPWVCYSLDSSFTPTDISATVLPAAMVTATETSTARVLVLVDGGTDPSSNPNKYIFYTNTTVSPVTQQTLYKWEGTSTKMTALATGGYMYDAMTVSSRCQGIGTWSSGRISVQLVSAVSATDGIRLNFKLYSFDAAQIVNVTARYGTQLQEYPLTKGTLADASHGAIIANVNTGLTADNGVTTYNFTWRSIADGVPAGDRYRLILQVSA